MAKEIESITIILFKLPMLLELFPFKISSDDLILKITGKKPDRFINPSIITKTLDVFRIVVSRNIVKTSWLCLWFSLYKTAIIPSTITIHRELLLQNTYRPSSKLLDVKIIVNLPNNENTQIIVVNRKEMPRIILLSFSTSDLLYVMLILAKHTIHNKHTIPLYQFISYESNLYIYWLP